MGKPTLLSPGNLRDVPKQNLDDVPIEYITNWLKSRMPQYTKVPVTKLSDRVLIVKSKTGSGKSTVLPVHVLRLIKPIEKQSKYKGKNVICTQPRVLTAITLAKDIANAPFYPDMILKKTVGYQTGPKSEKPEAGLIYATAGVLLAQLRFNQDQDIINKYSFIIIDEAHERSLEIDSVLMRIKQFLLRNIKKGGTFAANCPFILLASATIDTKKYAKYFKLPDTNIITVEGRQFGITTYWPESGTNNFVEGATTKILQIHNDNPDDPPHQADILVFLPGKGEILDVQEKLSKKLDLLDFPFLLLIIDRETINFEGEHFRLIKENPKKLTVKFRGNFVTPKRRIVLSTVVAETGLTIETLKYVIDIGWSRTSESYPPEGFSGLITRPAPQSRIEQRKGRVGRLFPGVFYPLYTEKTFNQLTYQQYPDIITETLSIGLFLDILNEQIIEYDDIRLDKLDMLDPPPIDSFSCMLEKTIATGMIGINDNKYYLTNLGKIALKFTRSTAEEIRIITSAYFWEISILDVITMLSVAKICDRGLKTLFDNKQNKKSSILSLCAPPFLTKPESTFIERFRILTCCDFLEGMCLFNSFVKQSLGKFNYDELEIIAKQQNLSLETLLNINQRRNELIEECISAGLNPFMFLENTLENTTESTFMEYVTRIKQILYDGYLCTILQSKNPGEYYLQLYPDYTIYVKSRAKYIVPSKIQISAVRAKVKPDPLLWQLESYFTSVLDGFINIDNNILMPRDGTNKNLQ
nr:Putative helicase [Abalone asfa-like virus]